MSLRHRAGRSASGFTLIEALVALLLCGLLLVTGLAVRTTELRARRALAAHEMVERVLSQTYEELRGGLVPIVAGEILGSPLVALGGTLRLEVEPEPTPSLYRIRLIAAYDAAGVAARRSLEALVYAP